MFVKHWGQPEAIRWLLAAAAVLYVYVAYWVWKLRRVRDVELLLSADLRPNGVRAGGRWRFPAIVTGVGVLYLASVYALLEAVARPPVDVDLQYLIGVVGLVLMVAGAGALLGFLTRGPRDVQPGVLRDMLQRRNMQRVHREHFPFHAHREPGNPI